MNALNAQFKSFVDTNISFNKTARDTLAKKLSSPLQDIRMRDLNAPMKVRVNPPQKITFWRWFYEIMKFTEEVEEVKYLWSKNYIFGFISRPQCEILFANPEIPEGK